MFGEAPSLVQFGRQPMAAAELSTQQAHRSRSEGAADDPPCALAANCLSLAPGANINGNRISW